MLGADPRQTTAENYRRFSQHAAAGKSPLYAELTARIAQDAELLGFLAELPLAKRQPNLLLGAVRFLYGTQPDYAAFRAAVLEQRDAVTAVMRRRRTQTNEPARCAVLLPLLARLPQPLALLEVGAAAGLCLLPDRYGYAYDGHRVGPTEVVFECAPQGAVPLPARLPEVAWRAGIDLEPVDLTDGDDVRWLEALVWPGRPERLERLRRAVEIARRDPPRVVRGDLLDRLEDVAAQAPSDATLVVFHTAVLAYLGEEQRAAFARRVGSLDAEWIASEAPGVTPGAGPAAAGEAGFVLAHSGRPVARCDSHGSWIRWL